MKRFLPIATVLMMCFVLLFSCAQAEEEIPELPALALGTQEIVLPGDYLFTVLADGNYTFSSSGNIDTVITLYDDRENQIGYNDDFSDRNFSLSIDLKAGQTVRAYMRPYIAADGPVTLPVTVEQMLPEFTSVSVNGTDVTATGAAFSAWRENTLRWNPVAGASSYCVILNDKETYCSYPWMSSWTVVIPGTTDQLTVILQALDDDDEIIDSRTFQLAVAEPDTQRFALTADETAPLIGTEYHITSPKDGDAYYVYAGSLWVFSDGWMSAGEAACNTLERPDTVTYWVIAKDGTVSQPLTVTPYALGTLSADLTIDGVPVADYMELEPGEHILRIVGNEGIDDLSVNMWVTPYDNDFNYAGEDWPEIPDGTVTYPFTLTDDIAYLEYHVYVSKPGYVTADGGYRRIVIGTAGTSFDKITFNGSETPAVNAWEPTNIRWTAIEGAYDYRVTFTYGNGLTEKTGGYHSSVCVRVNGQYSSFTMQITAFDEENRVITTSDPVTVSISNTTPADFTLTASTTSPYVREEMELSSETECNIYYAVPGKLFGQCDYCDVLCFEAPGLYQVWANGRKAGCSNVIPVTCLSEGAVTATVTINGSAPSDPMRIIAPADGKLTVHVTDITGQTDTETEPFIDAEQYDSDDEWIRYDNEYGTTMTIDLDENTAGCTVSVLIQGAERWTSFASEWTVYIGRAVTLTMNGQSLDEAAAEGFKPVTVSVSQVPGATAYYLYVDDHTWPVVPEGAEPVFRFWTDKTGNVPLELKVYGEDDEGEEVLIASCTDTLRLTPPAASGLAMTVNTADDTYLINKEIVFTVTGALPSADDWQIYAVRGEDGRGVCLSGGTCMIDDEGTYTFWAVDGNGNVSSRVTKTIDRLGDLDPVPNPLYNGSADPQLRAGDTVTVTFGAVANAEVYRLTAAAEAGDGVCYVLPEYLIGAGETRTCTYTVPLDATSFEIHIRARAEGYYDTYENLFLDGITGARAPETLPADLKLISEESLQDTSLVFIRVPAGVTEIQKNAFKDSALKQLVLLSDEDISIEASAFDGCTGVRIYARKNGELVDVTDRCLSGGYEQE